MHKLKIKLRQHTPLIHFQHDQEGATLRASEVKPKLDRFILTQLGNGNYQSGIDIAKKKGWLIGKDGRYALDYKMRIEAFNKQNDVMLKVDAKYDNRSGITKFSTDQFPFLLANMGGKENEGELMNLSMHDYLEVIFHIKNVGLLELVNKNIERFFALHNFGQRQTKGFGSFSVIKRQIDDEEEQTVTWNFKNYFENGTPLMKFQVNIDNAMERQKVLFSVLDFYWRCLKSGINYTKRLAPQTGNGDVTIRNSERYIKSYLWTYLNTISYTWEKKKLKREFNLETIFPERQYNDNSNTPIFARGMMGCPDKFEYRVPQNTFEYDNRRNRYRERTRNFTVNIENVSGNIDRISSPIYFKPHIQDNQVTVYILFDEYLIRQLTDLSENDRRYRFSSNNRRVELQIVPESFVYKELVRKFHLHMFTDKNFMNSTLGEYDNNRWRPATINISKNENGKTVRKWGNLDVSWKMVPRDFNWKNILNPNDNGQHNYVSFAQIVK